MQSLHQSLVYVYYHAFVVCIAPRNVRDKIGRITSRVTLLTLPAPAPARLLKEGRERTRRRRRRSIASEY